MKNRRDEDYGIPKSIVKSCFANVQEMIDIVSKCLSSIEIFIRVETDINEGSKICAPVEKGTYDSIETYDDNGIWLSSFDIHGIEPDIFCNDGYEDYPISQMHPGAILAGIESEMDFCTKRIARITLKTDSEDIKKFAGVDAEGVDLKITFPMYFCKFEREKDGVTVKVCTKEKLLENYNNIAETIF